MQRRVAPRPAWLVTTLAGALALSACGSGVGGGEAGGPTVTSTVTTTVTPAGNSSTPPDGVTASTTPAEPASSPPARTSSSPSASTESTPLGTPSDGGTARTVQVPAGATYGFVTPSGRLACVLGTGAAGQVVCSVTDPEFEPMAPKAGCPGESGSVFELRDGQAGQGCSGDPLAFEALLDSPFTAWWQKGRDPFLPTPGTMPSGRLAVLGYGNRMVVGSVTCQVSQGGVACTDGTTGQGFEIARARYRFVR